mmetsp:Transcript_97/g.154  ORF Transcript_97/g.154 Transcript_97/m.154 type:complete len:157 (+) Transcript_97:1-471(+)
MSGGGAAYEVLLVGWKLTGTGEVWIVQPLRRSTDASAALATLVPFGHYNIDDYALAPTNLFENTPWQSGPHLSLDLSDADREWLSSWEGMILWLSSPQLEDLGGCLGRGVMGSVKAQETFILRDERAAARSRRCRLVDMEWFRGKKQWKVEVKFVD